MIRSGPDCLSRAVAFRFVLPPALAANVCAALDVRVVEVSSVFRCVAALAGNFHKWSFHGRGRAGLRSTLQSFHSTQCGPDQWLWRFSATSFPHRIRGLFPPVSRCRATKLIHSSAVWSKASMRCASIGQTSERLTSKSGCQSVAHLHSSPNRTLPSKF